MRGEPPDEGQQPSDRRSLDEQVKDVSQSVSGLMSRTNNLERKVHQVEEWCYRLQGDL